MKNPFKTLIFTLLAVFTVFSVNAQQNDEIYSDGDFGFATKKNNRSEETPVTKTDEYDKSEDEYVDERYEYEYTARVRRFHQPARGFSYYSNYYVDNYYYDPYMAGMNIYNVQPYYSHNNWGWNYPYCGWSSYGYGWSSYGGFGQYYGYNPYRWHSPYGGWYNPYNSWGYNPYWSGYNNVYWNGYNNGYWNGWYGNGWNRNNNNNWNWFETSAPNAANFVTTRNPRGTDTGLHRSRNTPVQGYDTHQRINSNNLDDRGNIPSIRDRSTNPNIRNTNPDTRQPNVRPEIHTVPPVRDPNVRPDIRTNPPVREHNNIRRNDTYTPSNNFDRGRNDSGINRSNSYNNGGFNNNSFNNSGSRGNSSITPSQGGRSGGRR